MVGRDDVINRKRRVADMISLLKKSRRTMSWVSLRQHFCFLMQSLSRFFDGKDLDTARNVMSLTIILQEELQSMPTRMEIWEDFQTMSKSLTELVALEDYAGAAVLQRMIQRIRENYSACPRDDSYMDCVELDVNHARYFG